MKRYYLPSPKVMGAVLHAKGQVGDCPIYHCRASNTFWILQWNRTCDRYLVRFYPQDVRIDPNDSYAIPLEWEGEPIAIGINEEFWRECQIPDNFEGNRIKIGIKQEIDAGNRVFITDEKGFIKSQVLYESGKFREIPIAPYSTW